MATGHDQLEDGGATLYEVRVRVRRRTSAQGQGQWLGSVVRVRVRGMHYWAYTALLGVHC